MPCHSRCGGRVERGTASGLLRRILVARSRRPRTGRRTLLVTGVTAAVLATTLGVTATSSQAAPRPAANTVAGGSFKTGDYIVVLRHDPLASYSGDVRGYAATKPAAGRKLNLTSSAAKRYRSFIIKEQDSLISRAGAKPFARYSVSLNGFAARLTGAQAEKLSRTPGVLKVEPNRIVKADTTETPQLLGLTGKNGLWAKLGGQAKAGAGVVVGVIDSGYTPESPSVAGKPVTAIVPQRTGVPYRDLNDRIAMKKTDGNTFTGVCQA